MRGNCRSEAVRTGCCRAEPRFFAGSHELRPFQNQLPAPVFFFEKPFSICWLSQGLDQLARAPGKAVIFALDL
jgi:hypothetical protein